MKKISLIAILLSAVFLLQNCKKDTVSAIAQSDALLFAVINDSTWTADTVNAALTYNAATNTKVFTCTAIANNKEVNMLATQNNAANTAGFPLATYTANTSGSIAFSYYTSQKNSQGNYVLTQTGTVAPGSGSITVTAIDSVKKVMTGIFSITSKQNNYDSKGNLVSISIYEIADGAFNNMPYTFKSN